MYVIQILLLDAVHQHGTNAPLRVKCYPVNSVIYVVYSSYTDYESHVCWFSIHENLVLKKYDSCVK